VSSVMSRTLASRGAVAGGAGSWRWQPAEHRIRPVQSAKAVRIPEVRHRNPWFAESRIIGGYFTSNGLTMGDPFRRVVKVDYPWPAAEYSTVLSI